MKMSQSFKASFDIGFLVLIFLIVYLSLLKKSHKFFPTNPEYPERPIVNKLDIFI